jgi:hypothetical protein
MSKNTQRLSQVISTFGPGAMVDLPTRSVVIGGLEQWDMRGGGSTTLSEPRLQERLEKLFERPESTRSKQESFAPNTSDHRGCSE